MFRRLAADRHYFKRILAAVYQVNQRLRPVDALDEFRPGRPGRNAQHSGQIHPVLQPGHRQIPGHVEMVGRRILLDTR